jgi:hypothetical protein
MAVCQRKSAKVMLPRQGLAFCPLRLVLPVSIRPDRQSCLLISPGSLYLQAHLH